MLMRLILTCPAPEYFPALSHTWQDFRKYVTERENYVWISSIKFVSKTFFILRITERDMTINVYLHSRRVVRYSFQILIKL